MESATRHMRAHEHLYALAQSISAYDGVAANLRDDHIEVLQLPPRRRRETFTCTPRTDDGGALWFFDSHHRPVAPAGHPDAPLTVVRRLEDGQ